MTTPCADEAAKRGLLDRASDVIQSENSLSSGFSTVSADEVAVVLAYCVVGSEVSGFLVGDVLGEL